MGSQTPDTADIGSQLRRIAASFASTAEVFGGCKVFPTSLCSPEGMRVHSREVFTSVRQNKLINPLAPNDVYISRTAQLISRPCILNIYSTDILTEYFKHAAHSPFFFSSRCRLFHNAIFFGSCNIHILNTGVLKF